MSRINLGCILGFWVNWNSFLLHGGKMYKAEELLDLSIKPRINDISLSVLQDYYRMYLMPFEYTYSVETDNEIKEFKLRFDKDKFCHLLGIENIAKYNVKQRALNKYRGLNGWNNIQNGMIDFNHLKILNKSKFQSVKTKFVYFYLIPQLIEKPLVVLFDKHKVNPPVNIDSEMLFYSIYDNAVIHLGIDVDAEGIYFPKTFFVEKLGDSNVEDIYTVNQIRINATLKTRTILL